ncbi:VanZ family protein [Exilibacterium tricleocarpae]|uniref:VanZ family protein n=1 Tax=Exilibacterium tricleocarpae TaxID=2591008 RepID=UPI0015D3A14C|nr:VanZ family protein [Exilibacterium tricleocarpae]
MKSSLPLSRGRLLLMGAGLGVLGTVLLTVQLPGDDRFTRALQNAGHAGLFALLTIVVLPAMRPANTAAPLRPLVVMFVLACLALGVGVELVQSFIGRQASWKDIALNMAGVGIGLCLLTSFRPGSSLPLRATAAFVCLLLLAASFTDPALWWYRQLQRDRQFPVIAAFESPWVNRFASSSYGSQLAIVPAPAAWSQNLSQVARLTLRRRGPWPGLALVEVYPDWRDYRFLSFEIFSANPDPLDLSLRIHDKSHDYRHADRFNRQLRVNPGVNRYTIPLEAVRQAPAGRDMDMRNVHTLVWFSHRPRHEKVIFFDNVRLL